MVNYRTCWLILFLSIIGMGSSFSQESPPVAEVDKALDKIWMQKLLDFSGVEYRKAIHNLVTHYESNTGIRFEPGDKHQAGIKIYTNSGAGLRTPPKLVEAMIDFLVERGFERKELFILDLSTDSLWRSGFISTRSNSSRNYMGVPVYALDEGIYFDQNWFYDSPLPSQYLAPVQLKATGGFEIDKDYTDDRKSFLPVPLLLDVDFWINLPVITDHPELGINGTLANTTLWNISNQYRFMNNTAGASAAIAEIAAIPELKRSLAFSIVSLERLQFMGGPIFNSSYVRTFNEIYLSSNSVALDRVFLEKMNRARETMGFEPISPLPPVFEYAKSLELGDFERGSFEILETK